MVHAFPQKEEHQGEEEEAELVGALRLADESDNLGLRAQAAAALLKGPEIAVMQFVHLDIREVNDKRGVIGLGEPPAIGICAAVGNAVANAIGMRVPNMPMTPMHVLDTLEGRNA